MKKTLHYYTFTLVFLLGFVFSFAQNLPYIEDFENADNGSYSFVSNGKLFKIESSASVDYAQGTFRVQGNYPGTGWNGLAIDNKYIDNDGAAGFGVNPSFKIKSEGFNFTSQNFYLFLADYNLQQFPLIMPAPITINGKENGTVIFTALYIPLNALMTNGYVQVNLKNINGMNYSNYEINELEISTSNPTNYVGLDAFTWTEVTPPLPTIWENGVWSDGEPTATKDAILRESYTHNLTAKSLTFEANVVVPSGITYTVVNNVDNPSNQVVFENGAYLIQQNDNAINVGNISFKRQSKPIYRLETLDWSSPVFGQNIFALSPKTLQNRFYRFNENTNAWVADVNENDVFQRGEYIAFRAPNNFNNYGEGVAKIFEGTFTGIPNNGFVSRMLTKNNVGNNAVGNPYLSPIDLKKLIALNTNLNISNVFVWTHSQPIVNGEFTGNNWIIYTDEMGWSDPSITSTAIGVGQGFIVQAENKLPAPLPMQLFFNNSMRVSNHEVVSYKHNEDDKFWLSLQKDNLSLNSTLIGYKEGSTKMYENSFDAEPIQIYPGIYSLLDQKEMSIQGRGSQFDLKDRFNLAIKILNPGNYTISLSKTNGIFVQGQAVYLRDKETKTYTDLSKENYNFISDKGYFTDRFEIVYDNSLLHLNEINERNKVDVYTEGKTIFVQSSEKIKSIKVYNLEAKLIKTVSSVNALKTSVVMNTNATALIVWIELYDGTKISKKIIVK
ncbi:hypothetical protein F0358_11700 [Empedobacter brevis]|uniref:hypothetical protein n=1 Tax=Empedobacter brevis TaxID=247 RepID=UPI00123C7BDD|nr:hypothetical protein [Empedobacter brevis]QES93327.1 hypothetical protein F0358_11700 [Empedobacter brevis]